MRAKAKARPTAAQTIESLTPEVRMENASIFIAVGKRRTLGRIASLATRFVCLALVAGKPRGRCYKPKK